MSISNVLVTGAGGFIGGRLSHRIALGEDTTVTPLIHNVSGAGTMRLGRLPVDIEQGSILDAERMDEILTDCDAVVNCAHGSREVTVEGTRTLLAAAERQGVESYVHMSSAVVHGHDASGTITEETELAPDTEYAEQKADAERVVTTWDGTLQPTTLRPCIVYGPHSPWVSKPLQQIQEGAVLADGGVGELNQVYVDNLVDVILRALEAPSAAGEVFLVADDEPVTWSQYYQELSNWLDDPPPITSLSTHEIAVYRKLRYLEDSVIPPVRLGKRLLTSPNTVKLTAEELKQTPWAQSLYRRLPESAQADIKDRINTTQPTESGHQDETVEANYPYPPNNQIQMQSTLGRLSTRKVKRTLGWEPRITFEESLELLADWAEYEELIGSPGSFTTDGFCGEMYVRDIDLDGSEPSMESAVS